ncbi:hypothetical protein O181_120567 [Austropuccinia psidii MF-1]|uniref:Uncharacterized protein n=1 Tax=Austropuccinia psidii MF-1 TaxID=1389203 RepID=A0A9Q3Q2I5_9BASI|nr:hypothetical protein [Austropuccinia psidii MF-1]
MVERGYKQLQEALVKMSRENEGKLKKYPPLATFSDRISTKRTTVFLSFELQFGQLPVLPIDIGTKKVLVVEWPKISTTQELLEARDEILEGK